MWPMKKQKPETFVAGGETFGQRLCRIRKMRDMTQREVAELSGISKRALCSYECDQREVPSHNLPAIAEHLGVTVDELLGLKPIEERPQLKVSRRWLQKFEQIDRLTERKQRAIMQVLDMALKTT
jgi:transcriptional regulator with XRE-family HTH domain